MKHSGGFPGRVGQPTYAFGSTHGAGFLGLVLFWTTCGSLTALMLSSSDAVLQSILFPLITVVGAVTIAATIAAGSHRGYVFLALGFGVLALLPVAQGLLRDQSVLLTPVVFATATIGLVLSAAHVPARWFRWSLLALTLGLGWISLIIGLLGTSNSDISAFYALGKDTLGVPQLSGIFGHPNTLGTVAGLGFIFQVQALRGAWRTLSAIWIMPAVILGPTLTLILLLWSQSRTGLFGVVVGVVIIAIPVLGRRPARWSWIAMAGVVILSFFPWFISLANVDGFNGRWVAWEVAWREFAAAPLIGYGPDLFGNAYWDANPVSSFKPLHAHSQFLEAIGISGLLGLLAGLYLLALAVAIAVQSRLADHRWAMAAVAVVVTVASMEVVLGVRNATESYLTVVLLATVLGSALKLLRSQSDRPAAQPVGYIDPSTS
jgi:hypothetical protein